MGSRVVKKPFASKGVTADQSLNTIFFFGGGGKKEKKEKENHKYYINYISRTIVFICDKIFVLLNYSQIALSISATILECLEFQQHGETLYNMYQDSLPASNHLW